jgi:hypothetical protein
MHPLLAAMISYPFAAWLTMGGMFVAAAFHDHVPLDSVAVVMIAAGPVVLPFLLLAGALSSGSLEHRQLLEYGLGLAAAWSVSWIIVRFLAARRGVN